MRDALTSLLASCDRARPGAFFYIYISVLAPRCACEHLLVTELYIYNTNKSKFPWRIKKCNMPIDYYTCTCYLYNTVEIITVL